MIAIIFEGDNMALKKDDLLRNYKIVKELGRGRFGITYLAKDQNNQSFVVKTISDDLIEQLSTNPKELQRLQETIMQEAITLAKCQHPNIVEVRKDGIFIENDRFYLVEEYIAGENLENLPNKTLSESEALNYIRQIGDALICVHKNNLIHRDVKPANIMIRAGKSEAVLIDFGLAKGFDNPFTTVKSSDADNFTALELYHTKSQKGPYTDVYSLSATLYFLLTGITPPSAVERGSNIEEKILDIIIPPKEINSTISQLTNDAIITGLALPPQNRPANINEWLALLPKEETEPAPMEPTPIETAPETVTAAINWEKWGVIWGTIVTLLVGIPGFLAFFKTDVPQTPATSPSVIEQKEK
jgi:serine/threonine protein kinase